MFVFPPPTPFPQQGGKEKKGFRLAFWIWALALGRSRFSWSLMKPVIWHPIQSIRFKSIPFNSVNSNPSQKCRRASPWLERWERGMNISGAAEICVIGGASWCRGKTWSCPLCQKGEDLGLHFRTCEAIMKGQEWNLQDLVYGISAYFFTSFFYHKGRWALFSQNAYLQKQNHADSLDKCSLMSTLHPNASPRGSI